MFAVVDPLDKLVELGVRISDGGPGRSNLSLYYTQPTEHFTSQVTRNVTQRSDGAASRLGYLCKFIYRISFILYLFSISFLLNFLSGIGHFQRPVVCQPVDAIRFARHVGRR